MSDHPTITDHRRERFPGKVWIEFNEAISLSTEW